MVLYCISIRKYLKMFCMEIKHTTISVQLMLCHLFFLFLYQFYCMYEGNRYEKYSENCNKNITDELRKKHLETIEKKIAFALSFKSAVSYAVTRCPIKRWKQLQIFYTNLNIPDNLFKYRMHTWIWLTFSYVIHA